MEKFKCCLCGKITEEWGNDPWGAMWRNDNGDLEEFQGNPEDKCCDECNKNYVLPGRIYKMNHRG